MIPCDAEVLMYGHPGLQETMIVGRLLQRPVTVGAGAKEQKNHEQFFLTNCRNMNFQKQNYFQHFSFQIPSFSSKFF
jgi:hypothetical protein